MNNLFCCLIILSVNNFTQIYFTSRTISANPLLPLDKLLPEFPRKSILDMNSAILGRSVS